jgi:predicted lysophospholipase L1 biosynthesis ABC-type transport system permease subunit
VAYNVREALGAELQYLMPRPRAVIDGANQFIFFQSLVAMYGLLSLGVVGLLIRTLVMTNVQEQTRDMAVLRILGAPRRFLFNLVVAEVLAVGAWEWAWGSSSARRSTTSSWCRSSRPARRGHRRRHAAHVALGTIVVAVLVAGVVLASARLLRRAARPGPR